MSPAKLCELLTYDPETGLLWRKTTQGKSKQGSLAGHLNRSGYVRVKVMNHQYSAHRIAWAIFYREWPPDLIDHINEVKSDNRIYNLRIASPKESARNTRGWASSGLKGVYRDRKKWRARITPNGHRIELGTFATAQEAGAAYNAAATKYFGEFAHRSTGVSLSERRRIEAERIYFGMEQRRYNK